MKNVLGHEKKLLLVAKNVFCRLELLNIIKFGLSMIGKG